MADELKVIPSGQNLEAIEPTKTVQQSGEKNTYTLFQPLGSIDEMGEDFSAKTNLRFAETAMTGPQVFTFIFDPKRALTEGMSDELKEEFSTLSDEAIEKIKTFPTLFANENTAYGHTDEEQTLGFGYIRQIKVRQAGIKIYPHILYLIPQQRLNEALMELDLWGDNTFNEFNRTHWSIKKVDLISELQELGFQL